MTHNHPLVLDTARFFAQAALETAKGSGPAADDRLFMTYPHGAA
jgi:ADP-ribosylglycohydrolase